jgi:hypothetical protein
MFIQSDTSVHKKPPLATCTIISTLKKLDLRLNLPSSIMTNSSTCLSALFLANPFALANLSPNA